MGQSAPTALDAMQGRTVVITGATNGIGLATAHRLAAMGARIVLVGRHMERTRSAGESVRRSSPTQAVTWDVADLSEQHAVRELAGRLQSQYERIDVLINNAGAIYASREHTSDGLERTFALNHLAPFTLTLLLLPQLYAAATPGRPARIITVASRAHRGAHIDSRHRLAWADPKLSGPSGVPDWQSTRIYRAWRAYNNSKLANILFTQSLSERLDHHRVVTHSLHPGLVATQFALSGNGVWGKVMRMMMNPFSISTEQGSDTMVYLATDAQATQTSGRYWQKRRVTTPSTLARNARLADLLWRESARLTGIDIDEILLRCHAGSVRWPERPALRTDGLASNENRLQIDTPVASHPVPEPRVSAPLQVTPGMSAADDTVSDASVADASAVIIRDTAEKMFASNNHSTNRANSAANFNASHDASNDTSHDASNDTSHDASNDTCHDASNDTSHYTSHDGCNDASNNANKNSSNHSNHKSTPSLAPENAAVRSPAPFKAAHQTGSN